MIIDSNNDNHKDKLTETQIIIRAIVIMHSPGTPPRSGRPDYAAFKDQDDFNSVYIIYS